MPRPDPPGADVTVPRRGPSLLCRPAPVWARLCAAVIDEVVLTVPLVAVLLLGVRATRTPGGGWGLVSTLALLCWIVAVLLYAVVGGGEGQTPGKRVLGILVVDDATGTPIGYERALVRSLVLVLMVLPCCLGLLSVVSNRSDRHRGWHDRAAGSVVVRGFLA
ncbi:MAG TPA: RDD family protein [Friedmanniella sp.]